MENSLGTFLHRISLLPAPQVELACFRATRSPPLVLNDSSNTRLPSSSSTAQSICFSLLTWESKQHNAGWDSLPLYINKDRTCLTTSICCCNTPRYTLAYTMGQRHWSHIPVSNQGAKPNQPELNKPLSNFLIAPPSRGCFWREKTLESCLQSPGSPTSPHWAHLCCWYWWLCCFPNFLFL